jgi:hypothetical protein
LKLKGEYGNRRAGWAEVDVSVVVRCQIKQHGEGMP